ncbi:hypothetical protein [Liquorilactobacillus hordei]|uniref:hypothetical protein n=1 Tax=Liquorilactobacillus hordei TaxID=468911 RepID=UPI0039EC503D
MDAGIFILNGISSADYGVHIQNRPDRIGANRGYLTGTPSNRNGTVFTDLGVYDNTTLKLVCLFEATKSGKTIDDLIDWFDSADYMNYTPYYDDQYTYRVLVKTTPTFETVGIVHDVFTFELDLEVYPLKFLNSSLSAQSGTDLKLTNPYKYIALPRITITGSGTMTLSITGSTPAPGRDASQTYTMQNVNGTMVLDSLDPSTDHPTWFTGLDYPYLNPGSNEVKLSGTSAALSIIPRFARKVG